MTIGSGTTRGKGDNSCFSFALEFLLCVVGLALAIFW